MSIEQQFEEALVESKQLTEKPSTADLLKIYSLFKQAKEGDVQGERPGGFDFKAIAKYDAWASLKGKEKEEAMKDYIALIESLKK
ncbi:MAG: acyl-CoA-binding protein [Bacteroidota bacterium]